MDSKLEKAAADILSGPHFSGIVCSDTHGLCLLARGTAPAAVAGNVSSLADRAQSLHPDLGAPTVCINYTGVDVLVQAKEDFTMGLVRTKT